jgi:hypothetical protein
MALLLLLPFRLAAEAASRASWPPSYGDAASARQPRGSGSTFFEPGVFSDANATMVNSGTPLGVPADADCAVRELAYDFGRSLKPERGGFRTLYDALQLGACGVAAPPSAREWVPPSIALPQRARSTLHVVPAGLPLPPADRAPLPPTGSADRPFTSITAAVEASRAMAKPVEILLRQGTHFITSGALPGGGPVELGPDDSGLRIANYPGEEAVLSGAVPLHPQWKASSICGQHRAAGSCFEAVLPTVTSITGLRRNGVREIRARWPNFDEELDWVDQDGVYHVHNGHDGWVTAPTGWNMHGENMNGVAGAWPPAEEARTLTVGGGDWPGVHWPMHEMINSSNGTLAPTNDQWTGEGDWGEYWLGVGGTCADRTPAMGYWCAPHAPRGISAANHPGGLHAQAVRGRRWQDPAGAIVHAWMPYHWYTYMFEVRRAVLLPNSSKPARLFPGTNAIWGLCSHPSVCREGIRLIGNTSSLSGCQHAAMSDSSAATFSSYTYFHLTFPQPLWRGLCYGLNSRVTSPRNQSGADSGVLASAGDSFLEFARGGFQGGEGVTAAAVNNSNWYIENVLEVRAELALHTCSVRGDPTWLQLICSVCNCRSGHDN